MRDYNAAKGALLFISRDLSELYPSLALRAYNFWNVSCIAMDALPRLVKFNMSSLIYL